MEPRNRQRGGGRRAFERGRRNQSARRSQSADLGALAPPGSKARARRQGLPRNLGGLPSPSEELGTAVPGKRAPPGAGEVGVPPYERGSGGTDPRDPAEQRAAPG